MASSPQIVPSEGYHSDLSESEMSFHEQEHTSIKQERIYDCTSPQSDYDCKTFLDLSTKMEYTEQNDNIQLLSWTRKHPEHWESREVLDWVYYVAEELFPESDSPIRGEKFQAVTGSQLCKMTLQDFLDCDNYYGKALYDTFNYCLQQGRFIEPAPCDYTADFMNTNVPDIYKMYHISENIEPVSIDTKTQQMIEENLSLVTRIDDGVRKVNIGGIWIAFDDDPANIPDAFTQNFEQNIEDYISEDDSISSDHSSDGSDGSRFLSLSSNPCTDMPFLGAVPRARPQSSVSSDEGFMDDPVSPTEAKPKKGRRVGQGSKGNHLWEFIRDLLKDPNLNPGLLRWEDKEAGVFRFVQSEAVAKMWGRKKNNPGMTYEKLSRAMRFCRSAGYFAEVPKSGKFPKKLCFRFGQKAYGWKEV